MVISDSGFGGDAGGGADAYSTTNNKIPVVDEADIMKNDGKWIYMLSNGKLHIIDAWPPDQAHKVSETPVQGHPVSMLIYQDRLVVYSLDADYTPEYEYNCTDIGRGTCTIIMTYDITKRNRPVRLCRSYLSAAHYVNARRIGPQIYTVV